MCLIYCNNEKILTYSPFPPVPLAIYISHKNFLSPEDFPIGSKMTTNLTYYRIIRQCERNASDLRTNASNLT